MPSQSRRRCRSRLATMPLVLHHVVIDAYDLPRIARFWAQALNWHVLSEREREIVIGPEVTAPVGICFMPSTEGKARGARVGGMG